jgi:hypothetical protein
MDADENEFVSRILKNSMDNAENFQRAVENQKNLFQQLVRAKDEATHWKLKYEEASALIRQLMNDQNRK